MISTGLISLAFFTLMWPCLIVVIAVCWPILRVSTRVFQAVKQYEMSSSCGTLVVVAIALVMLQTSSAQGQIKQLIIYSKALLILTVHVP